MYRILCHYLYYIPYNIRALLYYLPLYIEDLVESWSTPHILHYWFAATYDCSCLKQ